MPYRPRELAVRAREAATLLLAALDRKEMVERFLDMYSAEHRRPGRADHPGRYREQLQTIRREAILEMVLRIEAALPARLKVSVPVHATRKPGKGKKKGSRSRKKREPAMELGIPFLDLFREEFFVALGQALDWTDEDAHEFWRDLALYERLSRRLAGQPTGRLPRLARAEKAATSDPFVDRVGFLLDPSLMDQARRTAGKFQIELNGAADNVLRRVFSRRREN